MSGALIEIGVEGAQYKYVTYKNVMVLTQTIREPACREVTDFS